MTGIEKIVDRQLQRYDQGRNRAWAYWSENSNATLASKQISYGELVKRTGVEFLPGVRLSE